ncbi:MAG: OmpA family protein [candidate division Zixibacteria bacterium]|nr:OmpA family protein [candidate division Zixibacteria bacterium]
MKSLVTIASVLLIMTGCGVKKDFVSQQIAESEARTSAKIGAVDQRTGADLERLQRLTDEYSKKADMALNKASGFENYQVIWSGEINFSFDSWEVDKVAEQILSEAGQKMQDVPSALLEVAGHTDATGPAQYNFTLGERRADAAKRYLNDHFGVSLYRMFTISYGMSKPVALPDQKHSGAKNRRVSLKLWGPMPASN